MNTSTQDLVAQAEQIGRDHFFNGGMRAPATSKEFSEILPLANAVHETVMEILTAFLRGWDQEHTKWFKEWEKEFFDKEELWFEEK